MSFSAHHSIVEQLRSVASPMGYHVVAVSWEDVQRGMTPQGLSCVGLNITDVRVVDKQKAPIYTLRHENWNEKLALVKASEVAVVVGNESTNPNKVFKSITLEKYLTEIGTHAAYARVPSGTSLYSPKLDQAVSVRFQTVFVPEDSQFTINVYNYQTPSNENPQNAALLCTAQGTSFDTDHTGPSNLHLHMVSPEGKVATSWLKAVKSEFKVGGDQKETVESAQAAAQQGHAYARRMGIKAMGTRFNNVMMVQVPLKQAEFPTSRGGFSFGGNPAGFGGAPAAFALSNGPCVFDESYACGFGVPKSRGGGGQSTAARVSKGDTESSDWKGTANRNWERHSSQHMSITMTQYYTVQGVPTPQDVELAIQDLNKLYREAGTTLRLSEGQAHGLVADFNFPTPIDVDPEFPV